MRTQLSVKSKVVLLLLAVSALAALMVGFLGWRSSRQALSQTILYNIASVRSSKAAQAEAYFRNMRYTVEVLSENDMVVEGMVRFNRAFRQLENTTIPADWDAALEAYYTSQFFPRLFANLPGQADYNLYRPQNQAGLYLQYHYIVANRFEEGQKLLLDQAEDGSEYSKVHAYYHPRLRSVIQKFGFDDLILVNIESGDAVYTVAKQTEFASNLDLGPYRRSNQADAVGLVRNNNERGTAHLVDFELYRPGYGIPSAFWAAPIYNGNHLVGVLLVQISLTALNEIMTDNQQWAQVGLGATGETYLVGADRLMRSDARPRIEDPVAYGQALAEQGFSSQTSKLIDNLSTTILLQSVDSPAITAALQNQTGAEFTTNYLGRPVLAAYQPLVLQSLQWAVVTEIDADEIYAPVYSFQRQLLIATVLLLVVLAFVAIGIANLFLRPLNHLIASARTFDATVTSEPTAAPATNNSSAPAFQLTTPDEWGELATVFREITQGAQQQAQALMAKEQEIALLQRNLLPVSAVQRLQQGQTQLLDQTSQVTLGVARIGGVSAAAAQKSATAVAALLHDLQSDLSNVAERYDVELWLTPTQQLIALCGLSTPYLDHSRRTIDFFLAARALCQQVNTRHGVKLTLQGALSSGALYGGVIRTEKLVYALWGESMTAVQQLASEATPDLLLVTPAVYERLQEQYTFQRPRTAARPQEPATAWVLIGAKNEGGA
jgi:class 3 adenylate cyclase